MDGLLWVCMSAAGEKVSASYNGMNISSGFIQRRKTRCVPAIHLLATAERLHLLYMPNITTRFGIFDMKSKRLP